MLHCSGTPCRLNCMLSSSVSLSPVAGKSERATLDWVWPKYSTQLEVFSTSERQNRTNMGIPANEKCMLLRAGANKEVMLTWIMWSVSSKSGRSQQRERERKGKKWARLCGIDLSVCISPNFTSFVPLCCLTRAVFRWNFKSVAEGVAWKARCPNLNWHGPVGDFRRSHKWEICKDGEQWHSINCNQTFRTFGFEFFWSAQPQDKAFPRHVICFSSPSSSVFTVLSTVFSWAEEVSSAFDSSMGVSLSSSSILTIELCRRKYKDTFGEIQETREQSKDWAVACVATAPVPLKWSGCLGHYSPSSLSCFASLWSVCLCRWKKKTPC